MDKKSELLKIYIDQASKGNFKELAETCGISMSGLGRVMINIQDLVKETIEKNLKMSIITPKIGIERLKPPKPPPKSSIEIEYRKAFEDVFNELKKVLKKRRLELEEKEAKILGKKT